MNEEFKGLGEPDPRRVLGLDDEMPFGKYKGDKVRDAEPDYIMWVHDNVDWIEFEEEVLEWAQEMLAGDAFDELPEMWND